MYRVGVKFDKKSVSYKRRVLPLYSYGDFFEEYDDDVHYDAVLTDDMHFETKSGAKKIFYQSNDLLSYPVEWVRWRYKPYAHLKRLIRITKLKHYLSSFDAVITASHLQARSYKRVASRVFFEVDPVTDEVFAARKDRPIEGSKTINAFIECGGLNVISILRNREFVDAINNSDDIRLHVVIDDIRLPREFVFQGVHNALKRAFGERVSLYPWSQDNVNRVLSIADVGVIPVDMNCCFSANKPENRAMIVLANGLPVVLTPTVAHLNLSALAGVRYAVTSAQWVDSIRDVILTYGGELEVGSFGEARFVKKIEMLCGAIVGSDR